jgi:hypothetical protein
MRGNHWLARTCSDRVLGCVVVIMAMNGSLRFTDTVIANVSAVGNGTPA